MGRPAKEGESVVFRFRYVPNRHKEVVWEFLQLLKTADSPEGRCDLLEDFLTKVTPKKSVVINSSANDFDDFLDMLR